MEKEKITETICKKLFKYLIIVDSNNQQKIVRKNNKFEDLPDFFENLDDCYSIIKLLKNKMFIVNIGYKKTDTSLEWHTKISKNKNEFSSGPSKSLQESVCKATYFMLSKLNNEESNKNFDNNIIFVDFKK